MRQAGTAVRTSRLVRSGGRTRVLVRLDEEVSRRYARAVLPAVGAIEAALGPETLAARVRRPGSSGEGPLIELAPWRPARRRLGAAAVRLAARASALAITDVRACYASIEDRALAGRLRALGCAARDVEPILRILDEFHEAGIDGLPVGPAPSAVLANAVLSSIDAAIAAPGVRHLRWVDDVLIFAREERAAHAALERVGQALADLDMAPAPEKTMVLDPRGRPTTSRRPSLSAVGREL